MESLKTAKGNLKIQMFSRKSWMENILPLILFVYLLYGSCAEFYEIASGTGDWYLDFSQKWYVAFWGFIIFSIGLLAVFAAGLWFPEKFAQRIRPLMRLREQSALFRWSGGIIFFILPFAVLKFSVVSVVVSGYSLRFLFLILCGLPLAFLLTRSESAIITWRSFIISTFLYSALVTISAQFTDVVNYPFSLGWSEGNRLWDYSTLFGRDRYIYPADKPLIPYLDFGRQLIGGLPFLWPGLTIAGARFWVDFINVFPYMALGWALFKSSDDENKLLWLAMGVWTFVFLRQSSVHPPLIVSAVALALVWRKRLWIAVPVIILASCFAAISRFTWTFAIGIWAVMLEFNVDEKIDKQTWIRSIVVGLAGIFGGFVMPKIIGMLQGQSSAGVSTTQIIAHLEIQPLLWYRLLPNATLPDGILLGTLKLALPLIVILFYLVYSGRWALNPLQRLSLYLPLIAFFIVGMIVSTKTGGGGDYHNLDMFFIGLICCAALAWRAGGNQWLRGMDTMPILLRIVLIITLVMPMFEFLPWLRLNNYTGDTDWLLTLTGINNPAGLGFMPAQKDVDKDLNIIRSEVEYARQHGEVLFMDQRQLLTFGFIQGVPLVAEYEKKLMMDHAMSELSGYYINFYRDLAKHRFTLIVSDPLRVPKKTSELAFGEENNYWVQWVSKPALCYYQPIETMTARRVQLLTPRDGEQDCSSVLPFEVTP